MSRVIALFVALLFAAGLLGAPAVSAQATKPAPAPAKPAEKGEKHDLVDLNSASAADLRAVPGIDGDTAKKIVENRPYKRKDELVQKKIMTQATYDKVKDHIIARQSK